MDMREQKFGIEIESDRSDQTESGGGYSKYLGSSCQYDGGYYEEYSVI